MVGPPFKPLHQAGQSPTPVSGAHAGISKMTRRIQGTGLGREGLKSVEGPRMENLRPPILTDTPCGLCQLLPNHEHSAQRQET